MAEQSDMDEKEREFIDNEGERFGWDGYSVEDAVRFARHFRAQRDEARKDIAWLLREAGADLGPIYHLHTPADVRDQRLADELPASSPSEPKNGA